MKVLDWTIQQDDRSLFAKIHPWKGLLYREITLQNHSRVSFYPGDQGFLYSINPAHYNLLSDWLMRIPSGMGPGLFKTLQAFEQIETYVIEGLECADVGGYCSIWSPAPLPHRNLSRWAASRCRLHDDLNSESYYIRYSEVQAFFKAIKVRPLTIEESFYKEPRLAL